MAEKLIKNNSYVFNIDSICGNGNGVARHDGFVIFVPSAAAGDILRAKVIKLTKSYAVAKIEEIITPSPERSDGGCPLASKCGGCSFQHITYEAEKNIKHAQINDAFSHIAGLPLEISDFYGGETAERYRNKAIYPLSRDRDGRIISGFYAAMSHRIVEHEDCLIGPKLFCEIKNALIKIFEQLSLSVYDETTGKGLVRSVYLRKNTQDKVVLTIIANGETLGENAEHTICHKITSLFPQICSILLNTNRKEGNSLLGEKWRTLHGDGYLYDTLCGKKFRIAPAAFYQVNHAQTEKLYSIAKKFADVKPGNVLFDLYCGTGTIGIILSEPGVRLVGVEISKEATIDAAENARINGVDAEFICLDAGEALDSPKLYEKKPDVVVIDPPRKGCGADAVQKIAALGAERIVYISCNPETLARDLVTFKACGYEAEKAVGVDLFPRTGHCECVVRLCRNGHSSI